MKNYYLRDGGTFFETVVTENERKRLLENRKNCYESHFTYIGKFKSKNDCIENLKKQQGEV